MAAPKTSERFCAANADLTISSSDGVLFKVHHRNLEVHSPVFASAESSTRPENGQEVLKLSESSETLELLFQFMYAQPQPDVQELEFPSIAGLVEAAEKYEIYAALPPCRAQMKDFVTVHPVEVLLYAIRHNHTDLANESALQSMSVGVEKVMEVLPPEIFKSWIIFNERWRHAMIDDLAKFVNGDGHFIPTAHAIGMRIQQLRQPRIPNKHGLKMEFIPTGK
ncbi:hypothetical protein C8R46DRAFT_935302 [Mycena filopes]|nr:hypothetical protein C8R46DRAFT_935302 [Mycena filopes]